MVTLVVPPAPYLISDKVYPSLGVLYVASFLEQKGVPVRVVDLVGQQQWQETLGRALEDEADWVGITCTTPDFPQALAMREWIKSTRPDCMVCIGGPHPTVTPQMCRMFDKVVVGDGWSGVWDSLRRDTAQTIHGPVLANFDDAPLPARHLVDLSQYNSRIDGEPATNIMTQLGCPFGCAFCCGRSIVEYRRVRLRTSRSILREVDQIRAQYGIRALMIYDDEFNLITNRTVELCEDLAPRGFLLRGFIKAELFTKRVAQAMARAGFREVCCGVESGSARVLRAIRKAATPEDNAMARDLCREYGIRFKAFISLGHPSETREDVQLTKRWLLENRPDSFDIYIITPYPGAPIYDQKEKYGMEFSIDYSSEVLHHTRKPGETAAFAGNGILRPEELVQFREEILAEVQNVCGRGVEVSERDHVIREQRK